MDMTLGEFFGGLLMIVGGILLFLLAFAFITILCGGLSLAFWNMWAMLGLLPMLSTSKWIAAMIFFSFPAYLRALISLGSSKD